MLTCRNTHTHSAINSQKDIKIKLLYKLLMNGCKFKWVKVGDSVGHFISGALHRTKRCCTAVLQRGNWCGRCSETAGTAMNGE